MFRWAIIFAVVALVAALLGFGGIAGLSADFAKILLVIGVVLFIVAFVFGRGRRKLPLVSGRAYVSDFAILTGAG